MSAAFLSPGGFQTRALVRSGIEVWSGTEVRSDGDNRSSPDGRSWFDAPIGGIRCVLVIPAVPSVLVGPVGKVSVLESDPTGSTLSTLDGVVLMV